MSSPVIGVQAKSNVERLAKNLPQSLILAAIDLEWGQQIAQYIATQAGLDSEVRYPVKLEEINLEQGHISVAQARSLTGRLRGRQAKGRVYIIYKANSMTDQAQNALLKNLEEPNQSTFFILLTTNANAFLPTTISRSQTLVIPALSAAEAAKLIPSSLNQTKKSQILFVASGNPVVIEKLVANSELIGDYSKNVVTAKALLTATPYEKIVLFNKFKTDREGAIAMLEALIKVLDITVKTQDQKMLNLLNAALNARHDLKANYNVRLTLMHHLML